MILSGVFFMVAVLGGYLVWLAYAVRCFRRVNRLSPEGSAPPAAQMPDRSNRDRSQ
jgi:hypothetical protein